MHHHTVPRVTGPCKTALVIAHLTATVSFGVASGLRLVSPRTPSHHMVGYKTRRSREVSSTSSGAYIPRRLVWMLHLSSLPRFLQLAYSLLSHQSPQRARRPTLVLPLSNTCGDITQSRTASSMFSPAYPEHGHVDRASRSL